MGALIDLNGLGHYKSKENAMVASVYSATKTYAVGDYVYYNGTLYRCTTAITTAEAWTAGHWTAAKIGDDVTELKTALGEYVQNGNNLLKLNDYVYTYRGITMTVKDGVMSLKGTSTNPIRWKITNGYDPAPSAPSSWGSESLPQFEIGRTYSLYNYIISGKLPSSVGASLKNSSGDSVISLTKQNVELSENLSYAMLYIPGSVTLDVTYVPIFFEGKSTDKATWKEINKFIYTESEAKFSSVALYEKWAVCGASRDAGYVYQEKSGSTNVTNRNIAWGKILSRKCGNDCTIYATAGDYAANWIQETGNYGLTKLLSDEAKQLYVLSFGYNDASNNRQIGDTSNVHDNIEEYTESDLSTMYGAYSYAILKIEEHAPNAHIICLFRYDVSYDNTFLTVWQAIQWIANHFSLPTINWCDNLQHNVLLNEEYLYGGHPTASGYALMANAFEILYAECVRKNFDYFAHYTG